MNVILVFVLPVLSGLLSGTLVFGADLFPYRNFTWLASMASVAAFAASLVARRPRLARSVAAN